MQPQAHAPVEWQGWLLREGRRRTAAPECQQYQQHWHRNLHGHGRGWRVRRVNLSKMLTALVAWQGRLQSIRIDRTPAPAPPMHHALRTAHAWPAARAAAAATAPSPAEEGHAGKRTRAGEQVTGQAKQSQAAASSRMQSQSTQTAGTPASPHPIVAAPGHVDHHKLGSVANWRPGCLACNSCCPCLAAIRRGTARCRSRPRHPQKHFLQRGF